MPVPQFASKFDAYLNTGVMQRLQEKGSKEEKAGILGQIGIDFSVKSITKIIGTFLGAGIGAWLGNKFASWIAGFWSDEFTEDEMRSYYDDMVRTWEAFDGFADIMSWDHLKATERESRGFGSITWGTFQIEIQEDFKQWIKAETEPENIAAKYESIRQRAIDEEPLLQEIEESKSGVTWAWMKRALWGRMMEICAARYEEMTGKKIQFFDPSGNGENGKDGIVIAGVKLSPLALLLFAGLAFAVVKK